jgi:hypothetical protein
MDPHDAVTHALELPIAPSVRGPQSATSGAIITSNLVFGEWDRIFKNPMTTAAAIDRLVHHSVILEFDGPSIRAEEARKRNSRKDTLSPS